MRSRRLFLAVAQLAMLAGAHAFVAPSNLLPNGGFERDMAGWSSSVNDPTNAGASVTIDAVQHKEGAKSVLLSAPARGGASIVSPLAPVDGGHDYLITMWYRAEGFSRTGNFDGVSVSYTLSWLDAAGKQVGSVGVGFPYGAQPTWTRWMRLVTAPAAAATARIALGMNAKEESLPSKFWLDRVELRLWDGQVKPGGRTWVFYIGDGYFTRPSFRRAADDDAVNGFAVIANLRFVKDPAYIAGGMYYKGLPPGSYRAFYRMKVAELAENTPVASLDANPLRGGFINARTVMTDEFARPGAYQQVPLRFVMAPDTGYVDFRARWQARVTTWVDTITIVEEEIYSDDQIKALFD